VGVVGEHRSKAREGLSGGEVDGIEASQRRAGREPGGSVEDFPIEVQLMETGELATGEGNGPRARRSHRPHDLDAGQGTRRLDQGLVTAEIASQGAHRSPARISATQPEVLPSLTRPATA
jgi:hypothetical protein